MVFASRFENLFLPVIIARKGKGDRKVLANFSIGTSSFVEPERFIKYFLPLGNTVLTSKLLEEIARSINKDFSINSVEVGVSFDLPFDRLSQTNFTDTISIYKAGYQCDFYRKKIKNYIWVELPVVVNEIIPVKANLTLVLGYAGIPLYFEDIIFSIEKQSIPLAAALTLDEKQVLRTKLLNSKNVYTILSDLLDIFSQNTYITSCDIEIYYDGCVLNTDIHHIIEWKRK